MSIPQISPDTSDDLLRESIFDVETVLADLDRDLEPLLDRRAMLVELLDELRRDVFLRESLS